MLFSKVTNFVLGGMVNLAYSFYHALSLLQLLALVQVRRTRMRMTLTNSRSQSMVTYLDWTEKLLCLKQTLFLSEVNF